ncbi:bcl-2-like protein 15 [Embiotoca jacksoni]|uniref:bcl-2-like protein 15 n=1 Tax=Embiotoca jacksoni TaxID=100190 RepID=UPI003703B2C5
MAPTELHVEWQTHLIIKYLLEDEDEVNVRRLDPGVVEPDSVVELDSEHVDSFDPVVIADKLRSVADALNDNIRFRDALTDIKKAASQETLEAAFSHGVDAVCQTYTSQRSEVAPEMQLIRATVAFALHVKKSSPELKNKIKNAMNAFLNRRVGPWVTQQGGWDKVPDV